MTVLRTLVRFLVLLLLLLTIECYWFLGISHDALEESKGLRRFFEEMDGNNDGQVDELEAKRYIGESIGGSEYDTREELTEAFNTMVQNMNQEDENEDFNTISQEEVKQHLQNLKQVVSVKEWVHHGLGLPQYAQAFKQNMITADDFPLLVNDDGVILENELKILSKLHRNQIIRGLKRLILGLGEIPSTPQNRSCVEINAQFFEVHWSTPMKIGNPPIHKYVIESGTSVAEIEAKPYKEYYSYTFQSMKQTSCFKIISWNAYGPSPSARFPQCVKQKMDIPPRTLHQASGPVEDPNEWFSAQFWTFLVIGLTIGLRVLTQTRIRILKCCFLWKLSKTFQILNLYSLSNQLDKIQRNDCAFCHHRREVHEKTSVISSRIKSRGFKIPPTQHFEMNKSHLAVSASSPALTGPTDVDAAGELQSDPVNDYNLRSWTEEPVSTGDTMDPLMEVPSGLIEGQCAHIGCTREWRGAFQFRNRWSRHFCSLCLRTYCYEHTHISPHGAFGFCGQHSRCVCVFCFQKQPRDRQVLLEKINKLDKSSSKKAELEKGCCTKERSFHVRSFLGMRKSLPKGSKKSSSSEDSLQTNKTKKFLSRDSQTDLTLMEESEDNANQLDQS
eukprot:g5097.t1